jgi:hypothetical protein
MPNRKQKDCSKGKIYFVRSNNPEIKSKYVGSTIQTLAARMSSHRANYKAWLKGTGSSCTIFYEFQKYGIEQFHIELIEDYPCEREEQLLARENFFIRQEDCVNKKSAITTHEEHKEQCKRYHQEHKEELNKYSKEYYQANREYALEQQSKYYQEHKEEVKVQQKQYYQEHKEEVSEQMKQYYQEHKEEITARCKQYYHKNNELITCVCGCQIKKQCLKGHLKSNKHKSLMCG